MTEEEALDLAYLRIHLCEVKLVHFPWDGEDKNLAAFTSKERLVVWYGQGPGVDGESYRDRGFYCRELAHLSRIIRPRTVVELGTSLGIGTCLLHWLNPAAKLVTVDAFTDTRLPGDRLVPMGYLATHQNIPCEYLTMQSWDFECEGVDFCFIDASHMYASVALDSERAWRNRSQGHPWVIAWHDHNERHPSVVLAVSQFCASKGIDLQSRPDSDTVWVWGTGRNGPE